jgi:non-specific serine/threonine protein kinase
MAAPGTQLGSYTVLGKLGAGGMGEVYLARDSRLGREVALKMLPREFARDAARVARFRQEALLLATLNHPNIATIYGLEEPEPGALLLVLERVEGETLSERLAKGPLPYEDALQICAQVAEALEVAHERGVVHRDLKPGNVMIGPRGLVKVLDFGLARSTIAAALGGEAPALPPAPADTTMGLTVAFGGRAAAGSGDATVESTGTAYGEVQGTPGYMSPEQIQAGGQDARTDIFAFGALLFECLSGAKAFTGANPLDVLRATLDAAPDWSRLPARTAPRVRELLVAALAKDPATRLREARAARLQIEETLGIRRAAALRAGEAAATPTNLPKLLTTFVGRERELEECARLLSGTRLLTLIGVGGSGKTRLALQLAENALEEFADGVWFVDLAPVADADRVELTVAGAVGVREEPGQPLTQTLIEHLAHRHALLVLDNCEHLLRSSAGLATLLLHAAPRLTLVATSREGLGVAGETVHAVPTLALPDEGESGGAGHFRGYESVRLFAERARLANPAFDLTDANAATVGRICRRLDGIPLAIELAAARAKMLGVPEILAKLSDRFRLLTGGSRDGLPRHQTLRATLQWSYDQLLPEEQDLLRRLSVFAGGWTLESAAAVTAEGADEFEVLDALTRLVDKSLVVVVRSDAGESRYRFLETVRQYALERLDETGDGSGLRERHMRFFFDLAQAAEGKLRGPEQGRWFERLDGERDNLMAALHACAGAEGGVEKGLRMAASLARFWSARGLYELGRRSLEEALARDPAAAPSEPRATALVRAGGLALYQGDYAAARPLIEQSLAICRALDDTKGVARSLSGLATVAMYQGDFAACRAFNEEGLALYRDQGNRRGMALALHNLAYLELSQANPEAARGLYEESLSILRAVGDREGMALTLADLGVAYARLGRRGEAQARLLETLQLAQELGARREGAYGLEGTAELLLDGGDAERAMRLMGAAQGLRETIGSPLVPAERADREALMARAREQLGEKALEQALAVGRAWPFADAMAAALRWLRGE